MDITERFYQTLSLSQLYDLQESLDIRINNAKESYLLNLSDDQILEWIIRQPELMCLYAASCKFDVPAPYGVDCDGDPDIYIKYERIIGMLGSKTFTYFLADLFYDNGRSEESLSYKIDDKYDLVVLPALDFSEDAHVRYKKFGYKVYDFIFNNKETIIQRIYRQLDSVDKMDLKDKSWDEFLKECLMWEDD